MNIGFYIENTNSDPRNLEIYNFLNKMVENDKVTDACLFFNNLDYVPVTTNFGIFDGSEIWSFTGLLIVTSLNNLDKANKATNKFETVYWYDKSQKNLTGLLNSVNLNVRVITTTQEDQQEYYRLTGEKAYVLADLEGFLDYRSI